MVRVLIARRLAAGKEEAFETLMREMRREAVHAPDDPRARLK